MESTMQDAPLMIRDILRHGRFVHQHATVTTITDEGFTTATFAEVANRVDQLAAALTKLGVKSGDRVGTFCWNNQSHLEAYLAIPSMGAVLHTLNIRLFPEQLSYVINHAEDKVIIVDASLVPLLARVAAELTTVEHFIVVGGGTHEALGATFDYETLLAAEQPGFDYPDLDERSAAAMCYTSGTTGNPKGVVYSHRSTVLHTLVASLGDFWSLRGTDVVMPVTPMFHANSWGIPYGAVMMGVKLVFPGPHLHPEDILDLMQLQPPTLSLGVPTIWMSLIQAYEAALTSQPGRWKLPAGMRSLVGGAAVPEALIRAFDKHGIWILQGWGMTETSPVCTISYPKAELRDAPMDERYRRAAMAGIAVPLVELRIRNDQGQDADWDGQQVGELQVRGPFITGSYHHVPVQEDKFSADGWLRTGDVASVDSMGFVRITDRTKDLIKSGGEWISSVDLENALMAHPGIAEAAVIAVPDEKWSERPLACVVAKPGHAPAAAELAAHLMKMGFAKWQVPDRYEWLAAVPRTSTGKFYKLKLREMFPK